MYKDREIFYLKADTDSGIEGLVLKNRSDSHYGIQGIGLLHDLFEHPYKPIKNPYLDEIAALGAYNEFRCNQHDGDIIAELRVAIDELYEAYLEGIIKLKWNVKHISNFSDEIEELLNNTRTTNKDYYTYLHNYKYVINHYFNLGARIFHTRFNNYFNSYSDLYYGLGDKVINKLTPLVNSNLDNIKLTINYKDREVKVEY